VVSVDVSAAQVLAVEGVSQALAHAGSAVDACLRDRGVRVAAGRLAGVAARDGAAASAELETDAESAAAQQGALRINAEVPRLAATWGLAPLQVLARLHVLAAAGRNDADDVGRPANAAGAAALATVSRLQSDPGPGLVVAALSHGAVLVAEPFAHSSGLVARGLQRVVLIARGVDTLGVLAPELGHAADPDAYRLAREALARGRPVDHATWVEHCLLAYATAADRTLRESKATAD
jgi:hypothetical protein